jgi:nucleoside-diphosphate-sugar epimerase
VADLRNPDVARARLADAAVIVHCAALPRPVGYASDTVFATNMALMHSAIAAAETGGARLLYASSYSVIGLPFAPHPPRLTALPVTEDAAARPQDVYALTKWLGEEMLAAFVRRTHGTAVSLRLPWIHTADSFRRHVLPIRDDPAARIHLWAWIDADDAAAAFVAAARAPLTGHERLFLSAPDTFSTRPTAELVAEGWPDTPLSRPLSGHESLIDSARARAVLGLARGHSWRAYEGLA